MEGVTLAQLGLFVATLSVAILSPGPARSIAPPRNARSSSSFSASG